MKTLIKTLFAKVAVDLPLSLKNDDYFYYSIPEELKEELKEGMVVKIPFGRQELNGYIIEIKNEIPEMSFSIKELFEISYKKQIWDKKYLQLADWISKYYLTNIGTVLSASIISGVLDESKSEVEINPDFNDLNSLSKEELFIVNKLLKSKNKTLSYKFLQQKLNFSKHNFYKAINNLKIKNIIEQKEEHKPKKREKKIITREVPIEKSEDQKELVLNADQQNAFDKVLESTKTKDSNKLFLLHGVTGSGKTEVYLRLIEQIIKQNKNVIYLVPEIYLVPQVYQRLLAKFDPKSIIVWHSSITQQDRLSNFERLLNNEIRIILGARSACLAPIKDLGLIIIDEAHDSSYKQSSPAPRYDTIQTSIKRAEIEDCPIVLGTATPNIIDYYKCNKNETILELPSRIENIPMPKVHLIDLRTDHSKSHRNIISTLLRTSINEVISKKEQVILLLNRRGYSSHIFCMACGYVQECKNCSVPMVFHKNIQSIVCHHCGFSKSVDIKLSKNCPECKSEHFRYSGIGTEQLEEEVKRTFPNAKTLRVDSDKLKGKDQYIDIWKQFSSGDADILIGTQIVAKGLDLPNVTLVGVVLADSMFNFPDYVSHEKAFQLLTQVTGRAGRGQKPGRVFIQTYQAENPIFKYIQEHDYKGFYNSEIKDREEFNYPPFTKISRIIFQSLDEKECLNYANEVLEDLNSFFPIPQSPNPTFSGSFLGPAPCFFSRIQNKYRYHILCKIKDNESKNSLFNDLFQKIKKNAKVEIIVDVDSVNLL